jgi:hypothetical protein
MPIKPKPCIICIDHAILATILDINFDTVPANIAKLMHIDKTNIITPSPQFNREFGKYNGNGNVVINNSIDIQRQRRM